MRQLLLLRHAKSAWDDPKLPDHARPLNDRGRRAAAAMHKAINALDLRPDLILVSSARRTIQTLEALEPWPHTPRIEKMDALYLASSEQMVQVLNNVPETVGCVMLIGHNPGMHDLALTLGNPARDERTARARLNEGYPTCGLAQFELDQPWWGLLPGAARLTRFLTPSELPDMGQHD
ncbi:SixA phosphatase family protein [Granulibacter bethesdensis]|uniref:SixA phosphatase family protein n=1 Tax=Granulibacter bethesdensis TaxID=364410 RepID=UPI0003F1F64C|nr:histidine phosphatase family protein [Granulibacter bethesdensis]AHJ66708.1 Phosphohistidine phosphatase sixA [Granulibacter bethesdensis CGDNIH4]